MCRTGRKISSAVGSIHPVRSHASSNGVATTKSKEDPDQNSSLSDSESCGSVSSARNNGHPDLCGNGLIRVEENERVYGHISHTFLSGIGEEQGESGKTKVVAIHKKNWCSNATSRAKIQSFQVHRRLLGNNGSNAHMKFAWFGTSKDGVARIMCHGFGVHELEENNGSYGRGIYLSPSDSPKQSVESSPFDEDGVRHVLLCRVFLGKSEVAQPGSQQSHPSSEEFSSGVDSVLSPKMYIIWETNMNTHILPEYVISFKTPRKEVLMKKQSSCLTRMPFRALIRELSKYLPRASFNLMTKSHNSYTENRISRYQLIHVMRQLAGDMPLLEVIKSWRSKVATHTQRLTVEDKRAINVQQSFKQDSVSFDLST